VADVRRVHRWVRLLAIAALLAACGESEDPAPGPVGASGPEGRPAEESGWHALEAAPIGARYDAHAFWTGGEVLVIGGTVEPPCPPNADCFQPVVALTDGAAYDSSAKSWREIADAPFPLHLGSGAVVDDVLYVLVPPLPGEADPLPGALLAYHVTDDRWEQLEGPPDDEWGSLTLAAAGSDLIAYRGSHETPGLDFRFDPETGDWQELPVDPVAPSFDRSLVWTGSELVLIGVELVEQPGSSEPPIYRAAALDLDSGAWHRMPDSEIVVWNPAWTWSDGSIVNASIGGADGGAVNGWGRTYPFGGVLDPETGEWSALPDPPAEPGPFPGIATGGGPYVVSSEGWVLHTPTGAWAALQRPPDAPDEGEARVWAGDRLIVWGGVRWAGDDPTILDGGWEWLP